MITKFKEFFKKNEADIVLVLGIVLISLISFGGGWIMGGKQFYNKTKAEIKNTDQVIKIEDINFKTTDNKNLNEKSNQENFTSQDKNNKKNLQNSQIENYTSQNNSSSNFSKNTISKNCQYIGSKNSNVYHLPDCPGAQRIKEENKICFSSKEEAEKAGYRPAKNCPGLQ